MSTIAGASAENVAAAPVREIAGRRDIAIDTMRGIAILMVIGIHSFRQPLASWQIAADAALRPCVPIFLFASGYLTALSGRVALGKRSRTAIVPYAIAFIAAYAYMTLHNPAMDHRIITTLARFVLAYVFVYYYVFVYLGCTIVLWLVFTASDAGREEWLTPLLLLAILLGLIAGSYLDPLAYRLGLSEALTEELRMRDIPFWFCFAALGALIGLYDLRSRLRDMRGLLLGATLIAYLVYTAVRLSGLGDAADYDSVAYFGYAALLCVLLLALDGRLPFLAAIGSGSYFIYLWHIFIVMALRDHAGLSRFDPAVSFALTFVVTALGSIAALIAIRTTAPARPSRWLGA
jgi:surface polysaccharide O-acyltransferase-like enzyme